MQKCIGLHGLSWKSAEKPRKGGEMKNETIWKIVILMMAITASLILIRVIANTVSIKNISNAQEKILTKIEQLEKEPEQTKKELVARKAKEETPGHTTVETENYKKPEKNKEKVSGLAKDPANILALRAEDAELKREFDKIVEDINNKVVSEEAGLKEMAQLFEEYWGEGETCEMLEDIRKEFKKLRKANPETEELVKACRKYKTAAYEMERRLREMKKKRALEEK